MNTHARTVGALAILLAIVAGIVLVAAGPANARPWPGSPPMTARVQGTGCSSNGDALLHVGVRNLHPSKPKRANLWWTTSSGAGGVTDLALRPGDSGRYTIRLEPGDTAEVWVFANHGRARELTYAVVAAPGVCP